MKKISSNYFVIFFDDDHNIFHAAGYEKYPKIADLFHIVQELDTNEEFGNRKEIFMKNLDILTKEQFEEISD
jgi:hypothetical protein